MCVCVFPRSPLLLSTTPPPSLLPSLPLSLSFPPSPTRLPAPESGAAAAAAAATAAAVNGAPLPFLASQCGNYTSRERNGHGREPEQPFLRHGQLPPRPLVTASVRPHALFHALLLASARFEFTLDFSWVQCGSGAAPRQKTSTLRVCERVCVCVCVCVGWIHSAEETGTHRRSFPPSRLFIISRFSSTRPHRNFSSIQWKTLSPSLSSLPLFFPSSPPRGDYNGPTGRLVTSQHGRCFLLTFIDAVITHNSAPQWMYAMWLCSKKTRVYVLLYVCVYMCVWLTPSVSLHSAKCSSGVWVGRRHKVSCPARYFHKSQWKPSVCLFVYFISHHACGVITAPALHCSFLKLSRNTVNSWIKALYSMRIRISGFRLAERRRRRRGINTGKACTHTHMDLSGFIPCMCTH